MAEKRPVSSSLKQVLEILHSACVIQIGQAEAALSDKQQAGFWLFKLEGFIPSILSLNNSRSNNKKAKRHI